MHIKTQDTVLTELSQNALIHIMIHVHLYRKAYGEIIVIFL